VKAAIDAPLDAICLKCLEKEPARRYATAADLAADLEKRLQSETIGTGQAKSNWWKSLAKQLSLSPRKPSIDAE
jgi:hypothetical protein